MKNEKLNNLPWIILGSVGIFFLLITGLIFQLSYIPKEKQVETTATIIDIDYDYDDDDYDVLVSYYVDGIEYAVELNYYSSNFYIGKDIKIYYNIDNPSMVIADDSNIIYYLFGGIGTLLLLVAIILFASGRRKKKLIGWLRENGNIIDAKYIQTKINMNFSVNDQHPYIIVCEWTNPMDNKLCIFNSTNIWKNPEDYINKHKINSFKVYINPNNVKQYYVYIDDILKNIK